MLTGRGLCNLQLTLTYYSLMLQPIQPILVQPNAITRLTTGSVIREHQILKSNKDNNTLNIAYILQDYVP